jgi:hypothetical protein
MPFSQKRDRKITLPWQLRQAVSLRYCFLGVVLHIPDSRSPSTLTAIQRAT